MFPNSFNNIGSKLFDFLLSFESQKFVGRFLVPVALVSFILHILIIALGNCVTNLSFLCQIAGTNYLSAIYTPFSIILFYEIFEMVIVLPQSVTSFMAKQYEVVSLIILREVFKDISHMGTISLNSENIGELTHIAMALGTSLILFFLVAVFKYVHRWRSGVYTNREHDVFINVKKMISFILAVTLVGLIVYSYSDWLIGSYNHFKMSGAVVRPELKFQFFNTFFMILVFVDIFLMIFSLTFTKDYDITFRNGAFIASTMMLRFSLSSTGAISYLLAIGAVLVGISTWLIYHFHLESSAEFKKAK